jgi:hypothetical protein
VERGGLEAEMFYYAIAGIQMFGGKRIDELKVWGRKKG